MKMKKLLCVIPFAFLLFGCTKEQKEVSIPIDTTKVTAVCKSYKIVVEEKEDADGNVTGEDITLNVKIEFTNNTGYKIKNLKKVKFSAKCNGKEVFKFSGTTKFSYLYNGGSKVVEKAIPTANFDYDFWKEAIDSKTTPELTYDFTYEVVYDDPEVTTTKS